MQDPDNIAARIITTNYFRGGSILEASLVKRLSYAWRNVFLALDLLKDELILRIEDGNVVKIWGEKWLSTPSTYAMQTPRTRLAKEAKVEELTVQDSKWRKASLIKEIFKEEEAELICRMPMSRYR